MDSHSPFACLLVGQPTLRRRIKLGTFAALDQRIALRYTMTGMSEPETKSYLTHHLKLAGRSDTLFSDDAVALIHQVSRGIPRAVSRVAGGISVPGSHGTVRDDLSSHGSYHHVVVSPWVHCHWANPRG